MGREFELKYAATLEAQAAILDRFGPFRKIEMQTTYFDTPNGALSAQKITLRLRKENSVTICTLKTPCPDGSRGEWECETDEIFNGIRQLVHLGAPQEFLALANSQLMAICGARFERFATEISTSDGTAELAVDRGVLLGGGQEAPLCEVEIELKTGSDSATEALAHRIAAEFDLTVESQSKFRRAFALAKGE